MDTKEEVQKFLDNVKSNPENHLGITEFYTDVEMFKMCVSKCGYDSEMRVRQIVHNYFKMQDENEDFQIKKCHGFWQSVLKRIIKHREDFSSQMENASFHLSNNLRTVLSNFKVYPKSFLSILFNFASIFLEECVNLSRNEPVLIVHMYHSLKEIETKSRYCIKKIEEFLYGYKNFTSVEDDIIVDGKRFLLEPKRKNAVMNKDSLEFFIKDKDLLSQCYRVVPETQSKVKEILKSAGKKPAEIKEIIEQIYTRPESTEVKLSDYSSIE